MRRIRRRGSQSRISRYTRNAGDPRRGHGTRRGGTRQALNRCLPCREKGARRVAHGRITRGSSVVRYQPRKQGRLNGQGTGIMAECCLTARLNRRCWMSDSPDVQDASVRPRRRYGRLTVFAVVVLLAPACLWAYLWYPRPMPDYIRLPSTHGPVDVRTWLVLPYYRQFYVKTRVSRPWQAVLQELGRAQDAVNNQINWEGQAQPMPNSADNLRRRIEATVSARPVLHGDYGDPLPSSYVAFSDLGPDDKKDTQHHYLFYRLTDHSGSETTLEVWDNRCFDP